MNANARTMLEALRHSSNANTREHAIDILEDRPVAFSPAKAEELAVAGILGDFLATVMKGEFLAAYGAADICNQAALRSILGTCADIW